MFRSLYTAASGMQAQQFNLDTIANNLANASTAGNSILDIMLGGEGKCGEIKREITEIEEQVLESIMRIVCREFQAAWAPISLEFSFGQRLLPSSAQRLMVPDEKNLCLKFDIKMSEASGTLNLAVPAVVSNALLRKISADCTYQRPHSPVAARAQIQKKLMACSFEVELCLPQLQLPLATLVALSPVTCSRLDEM